MASKIKVDQIEGSTSTTVALVVYVPLNCKFNDNWWDWENNTIILEFAFLVTNIFAGSSQKITLKPT